MNLTIHTHHSRMSDALRQYVVENLQQPLEQAWDKEGAELEVLLRDLRGGDKQGLDKECRAILHLGVGTTFVITEISENIRKSIHLTRKRLLRRVRQFREQRLVTSRHHRKHFLADVADTSLFRGYSRSEEVRGARETMG